MKSTWEDVLPIKGTRNTTGRRRARSGSSANQPPLSAINGIVKNHVPYTAVPQEAAPRRNSGDRQLHSLQIKIEVSLSLMIESQEDAPSTPTVLAAAMLRSAWEETNLMPETTSTTQDSCPQKENKKFALAVKRGKEKTRAKAGSIFGNNNNHSRNARSVRVAEEIRGGLIQVSQPKTL